MPVRDYQEELLKQLKDPVEAAEYLNACLHDSKRVFLSGLRNVVEAHGGVGTMSKLTKLNRESLYKTLSTKGNPTLISLTAILSSLGINIEFSADKKHKRAA